MASTGGAAIGALVGTLICGVTPISIGCAVVVAAIVTAVTEYFKEYKIKEGCNWKGRWIFSKGVVKRWREGTC